MNIRDDYDPVGAMMIRDLCATGDYVQRKVPAGGFDQRGSDFLREIRRNCITHENVLSLFDRIDASGPRQK